jgi:putative ABC transport system permease protein
MLNLWQDLRYGARMLVKNQGFTLIAVLTLALGIGANTVIFSVVDAVLLRPLPYPNSDQLVMLWQGGRSSNELGRLPVSPPELMDYREQNQAFQRLAAYTMADVNLSGTGEPERLRATVVSSDWFAALGIQPMTGRVFLDNEHIPGQNNSVVLSYGLWQRRFGGDPNLLGQTLVLNGRAHTVAGIMPAGFRFPAEAELWLPLALRPEQLSPRQRDRHYLNVIARRKDGVSLEQAQAEVRAIASRFPGGTNARLVPLQEQLVGKVKTALLMLLVAVGFVLLIGCANVGNLLLAQAASRRTEMAIRLALGAGRSRLLRQLLTESLSLGVLGAGLGLLLASWGIDLLRTLSQDVIPRVKEIGLDSRVLGFTLGLSVLTSLLFGLAPALRASRPDLNESLKAAKGSGGSLGRHRLRSLLVVSQMALALILLVGAGLLIRSFYRLTQVNPGFEPAQVLTADIALPFARYDTNEKRVAFYQQLVPRLEALPGVQSAGVVSDLPLSGMNADRSFTHDGIAPERMRRSPPSADYRHCSPNYFRAIRIPLVRGRYFTEQDALGTQRVAIINETLARRIWPNEDAVGKRITFFAPQGLEDWRVIVGVVGDVRHHGLSSETKPEIYVPQYQTPVATMTMVLRTTGDPQTVIAALREAVRSLDQDQPLFNIRSLEQLRSGSVASQRFSMLLLGLFAAVALLLAALGIYGVISYAVTQRTREIGVRIALGAQVKDVLKLVVKQGMTLALIGVLIGLGGALALTQLMKTLLFGVSATDPLTFAVVAMLLIAVALLAALVPARRATKVDPMVALRYE